MPVRLQLGPRIVGKTVRMNGMPYTTIGFRGGQADRDWNQISVPLTITPDLKSHRESRSMVVLARSKPGRTMAQAQAEMQVNMRRLAGEYPSSNRRLGIRIEPLWNDFLPQKTRTNLYLLMGAVSYKTRPQNSGSARLFRVDEDEVVAENIQFSISRHELRGRERGSTMAEFQKKFPEGHLDLGSR